MRCVVQKGASARKISPAPGVYLQAVGGARRFVWWLHTLSNPYARDAPESLSTPDGLHESPGLQPTGRYWLWKM